MVSLGNGLVASLLVWGALTPPVTSAAAEEAAASRDWTIRPEGLGRLDLADTATLAQARVAYPEAKVEIRKGRYDWTLSGGNFFVFLEGGVELFASNCWCEVDESGTPRFTTKDVHREEEMWVHPITTDPRFRTDRGIGVGSTVGQLLQAYPSFPRLVYRQVVFDRSGPPTSEAVCLLAKGRTYGRRNTIENVRFFIHDPGGKVAAGRPKDAKRKQWVDPRAVIVAVEPDHACNPGEG